MIHELLHLDLIGFEVRDIPNSKALAAQKKHSLDTLDRWWLAVLERGFVWRSKHGLTEFNTWDDFVCFDRAAEPIIPSMVRREPHTTADDAGSAWPTYERDLCPDPAAR